MDYMEQGRKCKKTHSEICKKKKTVLPLRNIIESLTFSLIKINILYNLDVGQASPVSLEDQKIQSDLDKLFKPLDKKLLHFLPSTNTNLAPDAMKALLQKEPALKA